MRTQGKPMNKEYVLISTDVDVNDVNIYVDINIKEDASWSQKSAKQSAIYVDNLPFKGTLPTFAPKWIGSQKRCTIMLLSTLSRFLGGK